MYRYVHEHALKCVSQPVGQYNKPTTNSSKNNYNNNNNECCENQLKGSNTSLQAHAHTRTVMFCVSIQKYARESVLSSKVN